jgi:hypothetical protein
MTKEIQTYLEWRCRMNWHPKYYKYIQEWIANVLPYQIEYFEKEREHLTNKGIYH